MRTNLRLAALALAAVLFTSACTADEIALYLDSTRETRSVLTNAELARLRACESTDNYQAISRSGLYRGAYQFDQATWDGGRSLAFVCGPERMMEATVDELGERGLAPDRIFVTLERHMQCGIGLCGHCQMGRLFVCKDGPVFALSQLGDIFGREGI